ncbi:hypothetical protein [Sphingomonas sp.]|uniref:hypothetical protein n=1 Tax=Sphingomonas sp. TaxID=28214 RepID=UPI00286C44A0|nr:hypothetical protein [Sphingomonas sp.]
MSVENDAIRILDAHRIMAVSTQRPDGWSQTTFVGYANVDGERITADGNDDWGSCAAHEA